MPLVVVGGIAAFDKFFEHLTFHGMPLPDEDLTIVINMDLGMPRQGKVACINLVGIAVLTEGR
jgi:hypothetical protein